MNGTRGAVGRARRALTVVALLLAAQLGALAWPAHACGCGGMVVDERQELHVDQETSLVRWDGERQDIVMSLTVGGDATEAAWIMPVPGRAEVSLGEEELFDDLWQVTRPVERERSYFWPREGDWPRSEDGDGGAGAAPPPGEDGAPEVDVVSRDRLGPFDVARLTATDPAALEGWLADNGFSLPDDLAEALGPYVAQRWEYVAVRLAPAADEGEREVVLGGTLDPIHLSFATDEPVYPMRLSRLADVGQSLTLYVLAPHRMEPAGAIGGEAPRVSYAARLAPEEQPAGPLRRLAGGETFLTVVEQEFPRPERIDGDHLLRRAERDTEFVPVEYEDRLLTWLGVPAWLVTVGGTLAAAGGAVFWLLRLRSRRRRFGALLGVHRPAGPPR
ncbi:DUF2330 domain-containing protein [Streptomyces sp. 4N509B]|uniref:DUF2330 domain-containing protein n=1 Tax=Streptomyces sp. 4N509B TaxID=3457413 RepID=UPI003FD39F15